MNKKTKHGLLQAKTRSVLAGFAVIALAAIFSLSLAGCPTEDDGDGGGTDWPAAFQGTWERTVSSSVDVGTLTFTGSKMETKTYSSSYSYSYTLTKIDGDVYTTSNEGDTTWTFRAVVDTTTTPHKLTISEGKADFVTKGTLQNCDALDFTWTKK